MTLFSELTKTAARHGVKQNTAGRGLLGAGIGLIATRIATRSVPGAIIVGGAVLGKYLWDHKKSKNADQVKLNDENLTTEATKQIDAIERKHS